MINEAIIPLKERTGSSQIAIAKFIEEKQKSGRGKLQMEMIGDEKTRYRTFGNRSKGLKKKLHELSTLCDVEACMILYHGDAADGPCSSRPDVWPENRDEVERIINRYLNERKEADRKRTLDLSDVLGSTKTKVEPEKNGKSEGQASWAGIELEGLSYEKLMELLEMLDKKIEDVDSLIDFKKKEAGLTSKASLPNCSHMPLFDVVLCPIPKQVLPPCRYNIFY